MSLHHCIFCLKIGIFYHCFISCCITNQLKIRVCRFITLLNTTNKSVPNISGVSSILYMYILLRQCNNVASFTLPNLCMHFYWNNSLRTIKICEIIHSIYNLYKWVLRLVLFAFHHSCIILKNSTTLIDVSNWRYDNNFQLICCALTSSGIFIVSFKFPFMTDSLNLSGAINDYAFYISYIFKIIGIMFIYDNLIQVLWVVINSLVCILKINICVIKTLHDFCRG